MPRVYVLHVQTISEQMPKKYSCPTGPYGIAFEELDTA